MHLVFRIVVALSFCGSPSLGHATEPAGDPAILNLRIVVQRADGRPAAIEPIATVETARGPVVTSLGHKNAEGVFRLQGRHCMPMEILTDGDGRVVVTIYDNDARENIDGERKIVMRNPGLSLEQVIGKSPRIPEAGALAEIRRACGE